MSRQAHRNWPLSFETKHGNAEIAGFTEAVDAKYQMK